MKKYFLFYFIVFAFGCQKKAVDIISNDKNLIIAAENQRLGTKLTKETTQIWINGYIVNEQNEAITDAVVECGGKTTITNNKGFFIFKEKLTINKDYATIKISHQSYMNGFRTFTPTRQTINYRTEKIMLQSRNLAAQVSSTGGSIIVDNIKFTFPADAIIKQDGTLHTGNINVTARYINPSSTNFPFLIPGTLSGLNSNNQLKALESLGMANVELKDDAGNSLEIAPQKTVRMEIPAPVTGEASVPLWHFNEKHGIWIQQGIATKTGDRYSAEVNHFSIWNIDLELNYFELNLKFQNSNLFPISNLRIDIYRPDNSFVAGFFTDNNGEATLINCPSNENLTFKISYPCDTLFYTVNAVTQNRKETITIDNPNIQEYQFTGTLFQCNNQVLANQPYQLLLTSPNAFIVLNGISDAQGRINTATAIPNCIGNTLNVQTSAFYNNQIFFSSISAAISGSTNYNATLCDSIGNSTSFNDSDIVNIHDPVLNQKIRQIINKASGNIYYADVRNIKIIEEYQMPQIQTLLGLQYFTSLEGLFISSLSGSRHTFTDISPITNLPALKRLMLNNGSLTDISVLGNLTSLTELYLVDNMISDISPIRNTTTLTQLWVSNNPIQDISHIKNLRSLTTLYISGCQISNIKDLELLTNLSTLFIKHNPITDISVVQNLISLTALSASDCQITNIPPLQKLNNLILLSLDENKISNIQSIENLPSLLRLNLSDNLITTVTSFQNCPLLGTVGLENNQISSLAPLQGNSVIRFLYLTNNALTDISPLQNNTTLAVLTLNENKIADLSPLPSIKNLEVLHLKNNNLSSIAPIINSNTKLLKFDILEGNNIPANEISSFKANHPSCEVF